MINVIFTALVFLAVFLSILIIAGLILWLKGNINILLPGVGLVVALEGIIMALIVIQFVVILLSSFISTFRPEIFH